MKTQLIKFNLNLLASITLVIFVAFMFWSLVPVAGLTMSHWVESVFGTPFKLSALMVAVLQGFLLVSALVQFSMFPALEVDREEVKQCR